MDNLQKKTNIAFKWSSITELLAKIITPLINMILARILAPEAFGILATVLMVIAFAEVFVESGFQKFLIQHHFENEDQENRFMSVAFWSNLIFSFGIWFLLIIFCGKVAEIAGNAGCGIPIAISGITIPLYGIIGIQNCKLKKKLEFKGLFYVRIISACVPLVITLPLALIGLDYWSLIIGNISGVLVRSILLVFFGKFRPQKYFSFCDLKYMLSYGIWTFLDGIATWATAWIDTLLISRYMSEYYLGLYKNSISTITSLFTIITAALTPVLFSSLSKLQDDNEKFTGLFISVQHLLCVFLIPLSVGLYCYKEFATLVMFGHDWTEAADIIAIMSITTALRTIFVSFYSDLYRAKGKFFIPLILQLIDVIILIPICVISVRSGFWYLVYARAYAKLILITPELLLAWYICKLNPLKSLRVFIPAVVSSVLMAMLSLILQNIGTSFLWNIISIIICAAFYFVILFLFKNERKEFFLPILKRIRKG